MTCPLWAREDVTSSQRWSKEEIRSVYGTATIKILAWRTGVTLCMSLRNFPGHFSCHGLTFLIDAYQCCHFPCAWLIVVVTALIPQNHWRSRDVGLVDGPSGAAVVCVGALLWQVLPLFNTLWLTRSEQTFDTWPQGCGEMLVTSLLLRCGHHAARHVLALQKTQLSKHFDRHRPTSLSSNECK